jgi:hypothetical protein
VPPSALFSSFSALYTPSPYGTVPILLVNSTATSLEAIDTFTHCISRTLRSILQKYVMTPHLFLKQATTAGLHSLCSVG